jgi:competence protein ComFC
MSSLFQTYFNSFKRINTWGIDLGCSGIGKAENKKNISFILPITSILIEIEIDKYIETKEKWSSPIVNFYKNGQQLFSIELLVGGNWFISAFWSNDERFIAITETDQGADHTTIVDLQNRKIIKTYGGYEENSSNLWGGGYGSRAIVFNGSNAIFLPTLSYESENSHFKYFDCENLVENIIVDFNNVAYNNLIIEDICVIKNILIVLTKKSISGNIFTGEAATCVYQKLRFININNLMLNNEIEEYLLQNDNLAKKLLNEEVEKLYANNDKLVILWNQQLEEVELDFTETRVLALTKPKTLEGNWDIGYYIDEHTLSSKINDDGSFNTIRTEIGELLYQFKYRSNKVLTTTISKIVVENCEKLFCSFGLGLVTDYTDNVDVIIPIPPSNLNRPFQPVFELVQIISELSGIPTNLQYLKKKTTPALKSIDDLQERKEILANAFSVIDKRFKGKTVLLFDDLYRSGETLNAAAKVLKEQGEVNKIYVLTITKTRTKR